MIYHNLRSVDDALGGLIARVNKRHVNASGFLNVPPLNDHRRTQIKVYASAITFLKQFLRSFLPSFLPYFLYTPDLFIFEGRRAILNRITRSLALTTRSGSQDRGTIEDRLEHDRYERFLFQGMWIGSIMPLSALFGGMIGGPSIEYLGRRNTILATALPFIAGKAAFPFQYSNDRYVSTIVQIATIPYVANGSTNRSISFQPGY